MQNEVKKIQRKEKKSNSDNGNRDESHETSLKNRKDCETFMQNFSSFNQTEKNTHKKLYGKRIIEQNVF